MALDPQKPIVVVDTSGIIDLCGWVVDQRRDSIRLYRAQLEEKWGCIPQFVYHPVSLAEIATNTHEEVLLSRGGPSDFSRIRRRSKLFKSSILILKSVFEGSMGDASDLVPRPMKVDSKHFYLVSEQRLDWANLRCTKNNAVVPVGSIADHLILGLSLLLLREGFVSGFVSSDRELLGAAQTFGLTYINTKDLGGKLIHRWKTCEQDEACISACQDASTDCSSQFNREPQRMGTGVSTH